MAVEYEISSDVATITGVASNTQVASIVKFYTGSVTYDDEPTSKYASVTINGKTQRVMLCVAVSGTVNYDDVPCLYSTVDGHRTLNVVEPAESGTPDDVPSLYETVVVDGKTVRALRCVLINQTPVYDGASSTCTFVDNGKTHTAQLINQVSSGSIETIVKGVSPLSLPDAVANSLSYVKAFGGTDQRNLPAGYTQLRYIESTGTQYIDLGIKGNESTKVSVEYRYHTATSAFGSSRVFGSRTTYSSNAFAIGTLSGIVSATGNEAFWCYDAQLYFVIDDPTFPIGDWQTVVFSATEHTLNGVSYGDDYNVVEFETPQNLKLFGFDNGGTMGYGQVDVARCKLWDNGVLIRDLVPCKNASNVVGMYDLVSGQFFTNQGTGDFVAGDAVVPTPDTPMDIVSNNGVLKYGYKSVNMFDKNSALEDGQIWAPGGTPQSLSGYYGTNQIHVIGGHTYTRNGSHGSANYIKLSDETWISQSDSSNTITMPNNAVLWVFNNTTATSRDTMMIVEGTSLPAEYVPYKGYGIYTDGTVETINAHGKNLFDSTPYKTGYYIDASGNEVVATQYQEEYLIRQARVQPSTQYTISFKGSVSGYTQRIHAYDAAGNWLSQVAVISNVSVGVVSSESFTTPANCAYIRQGGRSQTEYQLERGSTATDYVPYYDGGTATAEMLLKVGDYQDVQSIIDGVVTRNVGVKVLDGTEKWSLWRKGYTTMVLRGIARARTVPLSNITESVSSKIEIDSSADLCFYNIVTDFPTVTDWKRYIADQYAAGTPVIVIYPLATATTETVTGQTLQVQAGDNTLEITQASLNNLELEAQYQAAVSLTIQEVQDANLDPNVEVTIN